MHKSNENHAPQETGDNVQRGKHDGLGGTTEISAQVGFGQEARIDDHLDDEKDGKDADLEDDLAEAGKPGGPFDAVTGAKSTMPGRRSSKSGLRQKA